MGGRVAGWALMVAVMLSAAGRAEVTLQPEHHDLFFGKLPRLYLDGVWKYAHVPGREGRDVSDAGLRDGFFRAEFDDSGWDDRRVPGEVGSSTQTAVRGIGYLRRGFAVPEAYRGMRALLHFQGVGREPVVFLNGREVARPEALIPGIDDFHRFDVTDALRFGSTNQITVRIVQSGFVRGIQCVGIHAPVRLEFVPPVYAAAMRLTPRLPDTVEVDCTIVNTRPDASTLDLELTVSPWATPYASGGSAVTRVALPQRTFAPGESRLTFQVALQDPVLWSPFHPFLYGVKLTAGESVLGWERFGLREFTAEGSDFLLNGKRIYLPGIAYPEGHVGRFVVMERFAGLFPYNPNGFTRRYCEQLRALNCLAVFRYTPVPCETFANLCDEVGLLLHCAVELRNETELSLAGKRLLLKDGVEEIPPLWINGSPYRVFGAGDPAAAEGAQPVGRAVAAELGLDPEARAKIADDLLSDESITRFLDEAVRRITARAVNSPAFVLWAPEGEANRVPGITHRFPTYRALFRQHDPTRLWSSCQTFCQEGRLQSGAWAPFETPPPYDFVNFAGVTLGGASMNITHFTLAPITIPWTTREWARKLYPSGIPIVATESLYYGFNRTVVNSRLWEAFQNSLGSVVRDGRVDKALYARYLGSRDPDMASSGWWPERSTVKIAGIHAVADPVRRMEACGDRMKRYIEQGRIHDHLLQGFGSCSGPLFGYSGSELGAFDPGAPDRVTPVGEAFRQACAPLFVCASLCNDAGFHHLAGGSLATDLHAFNNLPEDREAVLRAEVFAPDGERVFQEQFDLRLPAGGRQVRKLRWDLSAGLPTGGYVLRLSLADADRLLSENSERLFVLGKPEQARPRLGERRIALFAGGEQPPPDGTPAVQVALYACGEKSLNVTFAQALEQSGLTVMPLASLRDVDAVQLLAIGPHALNRDNFEEAASLAGWIERGGRLLCMEQSHKGAVPFLPDLSWDPLRVPISVPLPAVGIDVDLVEPDHPLFRGIGDRRWWRTWNSPHGEVYRGLIRPLCDDMIATGAELQSGERPNAFGMLIAERAVGKGHCILSQVSAIRAVEHGDAVALRYLHNLIEFFLQREGPVAGLHRPGAGTLR